ncbi:MAG: hypothetical protein OXN84_13610, partial [Albidovulum sp.]|nr:hypothetical protein [Albidovulum sp.]
MNVPARVAEGPAVRSAGERREIVEDFERKGVTAAACCEGRGPGPRTLLRWRRLAREDERAPAFVSLGPAPADAAARVAELDLGGGMVLRLRRRNC